MEFHDMTFDQILEHVAASTATFLDARIDVDQKLRELLQEAGVSPDSVQGLGGSD
jgi:hypothetical protein